MNKNLRALESLGEPVKQLDQKTYRERKKFKGHLNKDSSITFQILIHFLQTREDLIETLELSRNNNNSGSNKSNHKINLWFPRVLRILIQSLPQRSVPNATVLII